MTAPRKRGRPRLPAAERAVRVSVRLPPEDYARLQRLRDCGALGQETEASVIAEALALLEGVREQAEERLSAARGRRSARSA